MHDSSSVVQVLAAIVLLTASFLLNALCVHTRGPIWVFQGCIEWLRAYVDFAKHHGLGPKNGKLRLELRDEADPYYPGQIYQAPPARKVLPLVLLCST
jgi:hypothetical protein